METLHIEDVGELEVLARNVIERCATATASTARVVTLSGDLGAGKTACVQAFAKALGITETVISPTYVIMKNYSIPHSETCGWSTLVHIDAYRIEDEVEMEVLGFRDILNDQKAIVCIEWPERIPGLLPKPTVHIAIEQAGETRREVTLS